MHIMMIMYVVHWFNHYCEKLIGLSFIALVVHVFLVGAQDLMHWLSANTRMGW